MNAARFHFFFHFKECESDENEDMNRKSNPKHSMYRVYTFLTFLVSIKITLMVGPILERLRRSQSVSTQRQIDELLAIE